MDYFYDGQIRRYLTQFMRVFIGFKYQAGDGTQVSVPVMYGDLTRQVASIIKENSENKMPSVPRIACYIAGLELDRTRLSDASYVSKMHIRERAYDSFDDQGNPEYQNIQGRNYTVERLMPTPFKLTVKADIWTSNTDQKLQLLEQIAVLFNPSLEIQATDNYIDWTSLSVIDLNTINISSRSIPVGTESDIDICSMEFSMPIYISPPAKVKKLGIVKTIIANVFTEQGSIADLSSLVYNDPNASVRVTADNNSVMLLKAPAGTGANDYYLTFSNVTNDTWDQVLNLHGGVSTGTSLIHFAQPTGYEITGTFAINPADPKVLVVTLDADTVPGNTLAPVNRIVDPYNFNPIKFYNNNIPANTRLLLLDNIDEPEIDRVGADDAWINLDPEYTSIKASSIIEWNGTYWEVVFDPEENLNSLEYVQNLTSMVQYRWDAGQWLKSFEGEYKVGYWRLDID